MQLNFAQPFLLPYWNAILKGTDYNNHYYKIQFSMQSPVTKEPKTSINIIELEKALLDLDETPTQGSEKKVIKITDLEFVKIAEACI